MHGAHADVVGQRSIPRVDLARRVRGQADQHVRAEQLARLRHRQVVLAHVHSVRARLARHQRAVVDDQKRADALAQRTHRVGHRRQLVVGQMLLAQLHQVHAARHRGAHQLGQVHPGTLGLRGRRGRLRAHQVQPRGG